jgi:antirestriction protein ArdC
MKGTKPMVKTIKHKADMHQEITDAVVESLEAIREQYGKDHEGFAWDKPWIDTANGRPRNIDGKPYRGINILLLLIQASKMGYTQNIWGTLKAWNAKGGKIIKGSKSIKITFYREIKSEDKETGEETKIRFLRTYSVFNIAQIEGVTIQEDNQTLTNQVERDKLIDSFVSDTNAILKDGGNRAYYSPTNDFIGMPKLEQFKSTDGYYSTLLHELTHWTGAMKRCNRDLKNKFGSQAYAFEELVAELGSMFLCNKFNILGRDEEQMRNHITYLNNWIKILKDDKKAIFKASTLAQKAFDFLEGLQEEQKKVA